MRSTQQRAVEGRWAGPGAHEESTVGMQEGQNIKGLNSPVIILPIHQAYRCKSGNCEKT